MDVAVSENVPPLLNLPATEVVCRLALPALEEWDRARARLENPADEEALHDFRVALRRFRSVLRAFRPGADELVPRSLRRRLRRLAAESGESRDLEVQRAWLLRCLPTLTTRQRRDANWLLARLDEREAAANKRFRRQVEKRFERLHKLLWSVLTASNVPGDGASATPASAGAIVGRALAELTEQLEYRLGTIHLITSESEIHAARILVKRCRYLIEPFGSELPGAPAAIEQLKQLQDLLGDLHDLHGIAAHLRCAFREASTIHADQAYRALLPWGDDDRDEAQTTAPSVTGGLAALARLLRTEAESRFAELDNGWLDGGLGAELCAALHLVASAMLGQRIEGVEIERKFLLSALPAIALSSPSEEIEQGWLPGKELVERIRHVRTVEGDSWFRTVKSGRGLQRIELEEAMTRELFEALWPHTEGRRVSKRRYLVQDGAATWQIDQFLDRELVLAEIELQSIDEHVAMPDWLTAVLIREVTQEPWYVNRELAR
jgi:CHAD domain-containing protein/CYTH domain-containing protein